MMEEMYVRVGGIEWNFLLNHPFRCYVIAIALQLAGAVLVIVGFCGNTKDKIIDGYYPGASIAEKDDEERVTLKRKRIREKASEIYLNRIAFAYIALGYILAIFGDMKMHCKCCVSLAVIIGSIILVLIGKVISLCLPKIIYRKDWKIDYNMVADKVEIIEEITEDDIEKIFNNTKSI